MYVNNIFKAIQELQITTRGYLTDEVPLYIAYLKSEMLSERFKEYTENNGLYPDVLAKLKRITRQILG